MATKAIREEDLFEEMRRKAPRHRRSINEVRIAELQETVGELHRQLMQIWTVTEELRLTVLDDRLEQHEKAVKRIRELTFYAEPVECS